MKKDKMLMCLICFVLGYLVARMMRGNGLSVGAAYDNEVDEVDESSTKSNIKKYFNQMTIRRNEYIDNYPKTQPDGQKSECTPDSDEISPNCENELFNFCTKIENGVRVPTKYGKNETFPCDVITKGDVSVEK